ncbi:MAG: hypothetical protein O6943_08485 [Bacteroidetes bacterium]|nr:hypothetical protein [Bacteroidota bacterium]
MSGIKITGETFSNRDDVLGMRYTPGARWQFMHPEYKVEYAINEHGFRDKKEHSIPKPKGTIRVLLVGDSFTFGQGVDYEQAWPVIAEKWFEEHDMRQIELVKAGIQGMDTRSEFLLIKELLEEYECDVIVIGFLVNDLYANSLYRIEQIGEKSIFNNSDSSGVAAENKTEEDHWLKTMRNVFVRNDRKSNFHLFTLAKRLAIASENLYCKLYLLSSSAEYLTVPLPQGPKQKLKITEILFKRIADYCQSKGKKLIVFSMPQQFQVLYLQQSFNSECIDVHYYDRHFSNMANQETFIWVAILNAFINNNTEHENMFYRLDGHFTPTGNEFVAENFLLKVLPFIEETTLIPKNKRE